MSCSHQPRPATAFLFPRWDSEDEGYCAVQFGRASGGFFVRGGTARATAGLPNLGTFAKKRKSGWIGNLSKAQQQASLGPPEQAALLQPASFSSPSFLPPPGELALVLFSILLPFRTRAPARGRTDERTASAEGSGS